LIRLQFKYALLFLAWILASFGTLASLVSSEIYGFVPCQLCWLQRIALFPQTVILGTACFYFDLKVVRYVLPLNLFGLAIAIYQVLHLTPYFSKGCTSGCVPTYQGDLLFWVPILSLINFILISLFLFLARQEEKV